MMHPFNLRRFLGRAWLALLLALVGSTPVWAGHPALWRAKAGDTTVYLFGTVHTLPKDVQWHFPALDKALAASKVLYIEAADLDPATVQPLVMQYGLDPAHPLSQKLSAADNKRLKQAAKEIGLPGGMTAINMMKPWLAAVTVTAAPLLKAGFDPELGVDKQLQAQMKQAGKPVKGLETAKQQIEFLADMDEATQLKLLDQTLHEYAHAEATLNAIIDAWKQGNVDALTHVIVAKMKGRAPKLYRTLIVKRNQAWAHKIAAIMHDTHGTIFIAVGSGHLVGPDRVQAQLAKLDIPSTRVND
jgi:uncharacterized protein YbaP (TraB family)